MPVTFKIASIVEPKWAIELPDGSTKEYDPWKLQQDIVTEQAKDKADAYEAIRIAFGVPTEKEVTEIEPDKPFTFTRNQCIAAVNALGEYLDSLPVSKKASSLSPK